MEYTVGEVARSSGVTVRTLHVYDTTRGAVDHTHWWLDLPGVYAPAALLTVLTIVLARQQGDRHANRALAKTDRGEDANQQHCNNPNHKVVFLFE